MNVIIYLDLCDDLVLIMPFNMLLQESPGSFLPFWGNMKKLQCIDIVLMDTTIGDNNSSVLQSHLEAGTTTQFIVNTGDSSLHVINRVP